MNEQKTSPADNHVLAQLSQELISKLGLENVWLSAGKIVQRSDDPVRDVYFPTSAIVAVVANIPNGRTVEIGICGREGVVGVSGLLGDSGDSKLDRTVQVPGEAFRAPLETVQQEFDNCGVLQKGVLKFAQQFTRELAMTMVCNRFSNVDERLARWLIMRHDRLDDDVIPVTQEYIAQMLGVNRSTITLAANRLQDQGYIKYAWGRITILDRKAMESATGC